jgi:hypothetical protein
MTCSIYHKKLVGDINHQYELCEEKMIKNGIGMINKWMVKVAHPM